LSRRLGVVLFANGSSKSKAFHKKKYRPGMHGKKMSGKPSEYGKQLMEKQKARVMYGISEKQSQMYYEQAKKSPLATGFAYFQFLEQRLDNAVFRSGIATTRSQARQLVSHGLVKLNGRKVDVPSIQVKEGDKFEIKEQKKNSPLFAEIKKAKTSSPKWLKADLSELKGEVIKSPDEEDIDSLKIVNPQLIVEYYSK
jgi:small subunit ribosomal protein S4